MPHLSTARTNATRTPVTTLKLFRLGNFLTNKLTFVILKNSPKDKQIKEEKIKGLQRYFSLLASEALYTLCV